MTNLSYKIKGGLIGLIVIPIISALIIYTFFDFTIVRPSNYLELFFPGMEPIVSFFCWGSCSKSLVITSAFVGHIVLNFLIGFVIGAFIERRKNKQHLT